MSEYSFFSAILGLSSEWRVSHLAVDKQTGITEIHIQNQGSGMLHCAVCGADQVSVRTRRARWLHENHHNFKYIISATLPIVDCEHCGTIKQHAPWVHAGKSFRELVSD